jgi:hypothetical protein
MEDDATVPGEDRVSIEAPDVYRFPAALRVALQGGALAFPVMGLFVHRSFHRPLEWYEVTFLTFFFGGFGLIAALQLWVVTRYSLEARVGSITVKDWRGTRVTRTNEIHKVAIAYPWRRNGYIDISDSRGKRLEHIDGGLQDFEELAAFIMNQCPDGATVRERRPGERWTERVI